MKTKSIMALSWPTTQHASQIGADVAEGGEELAQHVGQRRQIGEVQRRQQALKLVQPLADETIDK